MTAEHNRKLPRNYSTATTGAARAVATSSGRCEWYKRSESSRELGKRSLLSPLSIIPA